MVISSKQYYYCIFTS